MTGPSGKGTARPGHSGPWPPCLGHREAAIAVMEATGGGRISERDHMVGSLAPRNFLGAIPTNGLNHTRTDEDVPMIEHPQSGADERLHLERFLRKSATYFGLAPFRNRSSTGVRLPQSARSGRQARGRHPARNGPRPGDSPPNRRVETASQREGCPRGAGGRGRARRGATGGGGAWRARSCCRGRRRLADRQSSSRRVIRVIRLPSPSTSTSNSMGLQQTGQSSM